MISPVPNAGLFIYGRKLVSIEPVIASELAICAASGVNKEKLLDFTSLPLLNLSLLPSVLCISCFAMQSTMSNRVVFNVSHLSFKKTDPTPPPLLLHVAF